MKYFSKQLFEKFNVPEEMQVFTNTSIIKKIDQADKIVMHHWFYNYCVFYKEQFTHLHLLLVDDIVYDHYHHSYVHTLRIENKSDISYTINERYHFHRLLLLDNNRIALITQSATDYKIEIYELLDVDYESETNETLQWLKYKIAYEHAPITFENENNFYEIEF